jgi:hypothetical protein
MKVKANCSLNWLGYLIGSRDEDQEEVISSSSFLYGHEDFNSGCRFVKGYCWAFLFSVPLWLIIALILFL